LVDDLRSKRFLSTILEFILLVRSRSGRDENTFRVRRVRKLVSDRGWAAICWAYSMLRRAEWSPAILRLSGSLGSSRWSKSPPFLPEPLEIDIGVHAASDTGFSSSVRRHGELVGDCGDLLVLISNRPDLESLAAGSRLLSIRLDSFFHTLRRSFLPAGRDFIDI